MFLNLGSSDFEVTISNFYAKRDNITDKNGNVLKIGDMTENIEILSQVSDNWVSGRLFDHELLDILANHFNSLKGREGKADIRENPRIVNRLLKEVSKIKDTLSANKEIIVNIPEVADYQNLKMSIQRTEFEQKIDKYLQYLEQTIRLALDKAKLDISNLSAVEIIGGALRVPKIKDIFTDIFGDQIIGNHINGDESMSFGAAFIGANVSSSFVVRKLNLHKAQEEPILISFESLNLTKLDKDYVKKKFMFFDGGENIKKKYVVASMNDLKVEYYSKSKGIIHTVHLTGIPDILESEEYKNNGTTPNVVFETTFNSNGIIEVNSVAARIIQTRYVLKNKKMPINVSTNSTINGNYSNSSEFNSAFLENSQQKNDQADNETRNESSEDNLSEQNTTISTNSSAKNGSSYTYISDLVPENKTVTLPMSYKEIFIGHQPLSIDQKITALAHIVDLERRDIEIISTLKAKNDLESLIYSSRDWISNPDYHVYSTPEVVEDYLKKLDQNENWLYEEGYNQKLEVYNEKIKDINSTISDIKYRVNEHRIRKDAYISLKIFLQNATGELPGLSEKFPWIQEEEISYVKDITLNATKWFKDAFSQQDKIPLNQDPILKSKEIYQKTSVVIESFKRLTLIPKPNDWDKIKREEKLKSSNVEQNITVTNSTDDILISTFNVTEEQMSNWTANATQGNKTKDKEDEFIKEDL